MTLVSLSPIADFLQPPLGRRLATAALRALPTIVALCLVANTTAPAQGTHLWTQSRLDDFTKGSPNGVELTSDGHLLPGPLVAEVATTASSFAWSVAEAADGTAYVGTASPATVLRIAPDGKTTTLFETKDVSAQVVRLGPDGALYAATLPSGKVYRLKTDGKQDEATAQVIFDAGKIDPAKPEAAAKNPSRFIWDMLFDAKGRLYIATGGPGIVYRIGDPSAKVPAKPEVFFASDEQHIRALAWDRQGNLIAGTDGSGLIYRIDATGKAFVLFNAPRREITALATGADGAIYAANVGEKNRNPLPPLPVQGGSSVTIPLVQPASMQVANASQSLPDGTEIYELAPDRAPRKLWGDKDEIVYALEATNDGLLALAGNRGHILRIHKDGGFAQIAQVDAQQPLAFAGDLDAGATRGLLVATGNTGKLFRLTLGAGEHSYASDILDTGGYSRWGRIEVEPGARGFQILTRTGNVEQPARNQKDWGWSAWQPLQNGQDGQDGQIASPPARYLEWKAVLQPDGQLGGVGVNYLPENQAPVVDDLVVVPGARWMPQPAQNGQPPMVMIPFPSANQNSANPFDGNAAGPLPAQKDRAAVTARWAAHDENGDDLSFDLFLRGDGETAWRPLKTGVTERAYSWDAALLPDGGYQLKVVATDAPSHSPGDALTAEKVSDRFEIDTTPPVLSGLKAHVADGQILAEFVAEDATSPIGHAEYSLDAGPWQYIEPVGHLSDAKREAYRFAVPLPSDPPSKAHDPAQHLITVRAYDRNENAGLGKALVHTRAEE